MNDLALETYRNLSLPTKDFYSLGNTLTWASYKGYEDIVAAILAHPSGNDISANARFGLHDSLRKAIYLGHDEIIEKILAHPNAKDLNTDNIAITIATMLSAHETGFLENVLDHPNAKNIPTTGPNSLDAILAQALQAENKTVLDWIFTHPNATQISESGQCWLQEAFGTVSDWKNADYSIEKILASPQAHTIPTRGPNSIEEVLRRAIRIQNTPSALAILNSKEAYRIAVEGEYGLQYYAESDQVDPKIREKAQKLIESREKGTSHEANKGDTPLDPPSTRMQAPDATPLTPQTRQR